MNVGLHRRPGRAAQHSDGTEKHNEQIRTGVTLLTTVDMDGLVKNAHKLLGGQQKMPGQGRIVFVPSSQKETECKLTR